jgi:hypothetical protein
MKKEHGPCQVSMSNILDNYRYDENDIEWQDLAACLGMDTLLFFEKYESDIQIAKAVDQCCLSCPVRKMCYQAGIDNTEYGVWGGVYLTLGKADKMKNEHKTKEIWKKIK